MCCRNEKTDRIFHKVPDAFKCDHYFDRDFWVGKFIYDEPFFLPEGNPRKIWVNVSYPMASPSEIEEGIAKKIEQKLDGMSGIEELTSTSMENTCTVTIKAFEGEDLNELKQEIESAVDQISDFPERAEKPRITKQKTTGMGARVAFVALKGPDEQDLKELKRIADEVKDDLLRFNELSDVTLVGLPNLELVVEISEEQLQRYNLTIDYVSNIIKQSNLDISSGIVKTEAEEIIIRSRQKSIRPTDIGEIIIKASDNGIVRVKDLVTDKTRLQFEDSPFASYVNHKRSVVFEIKKLPEQDLKKIAAFVQGFIEKFNAKHPGYELTTLFSFSEMLDERIALLSRNGMIGLVLVLVVLGFFLSLRLSTWVAFGIPFSMLGMIAIGVLYGMTINMISLFGMILVVGILVDDGIVIAENIYAHFERGKSSYRAALDGTMEVLSSVFTSVLTTIIAFGVLLFIDGDMQMMREMAFAVVACLAFSLIEAFLVLPSHLASKSILSKKKVGWYARIRAGIEAWITRRKDAYERVMRWLMKRYWWNVYVPLAFIFLIIGFLAFGLIQTTFFPHTPFDDFTIQVAFKPGESKEQTIRAIELYEAKAWEVKEELKKETGDELVSYISKEYGRAESLNESGPHTAQIRISLDIEGRTDYSSDDIAQLVREKIGKPTNVEKFYIGGEYRWGKPISYSIIGPSNAEVKKAAKYVSNRLNEMPEIINVTDNSGTGYNEVYIDPKPAAFKLGLTTATILNQVRQSFYGDEAQRLIVGKDEVKLWVRFPESNRKHIQQLEQLRIRTVTNQLIPLSEVANLSMDRGEVAIHHYQMDNEITISADMLNPYGSASELNGIIDKSILTDLKLAYPDIAVKMRGQAERAGKSMASLTSMFMLAIFLIVLTLAINFNSLSQALLIMLVLPVGFASAAFGHFIESFQLSTLSAWGFVALLGVLINDSVVMLDMFNKKVKSGMDVTEAAIEAGKSRFRAIILTSITTVAGIYPLILEKSFQAKFLQPMAISVCYGILFGTIFILFFFPVLIRFFNDMLLPIHQLWHGKKFKSEEIEPVIRKGKRVGEIDF